MRYHGITSLISCDNVIIYLVSLPHEIKSKCLAHDHTDFPLKDHCQQDSLLNSKERFSFSFSFVTRCNSRQLRCKDHKENIVCDNQRC